MQDKSLQINIFDYICLNTPNLLEIEILFGIVHLITKPHWNMMQKYFRKETNKLCKIFSSNRYNPFQTYSKQIVLKSGKVQKK